MDFRQVGRRILDSAAPAVPFVVQSSMSAAAFTAGLATTQAVGYVCRISCATPVLSSAFGLVGVGFASALAGQASLQCQRYYRGASPLAPPSMHRKDMLLDALMGAALWKAMGGRYRSLLPSDLFAPGAMAVESIPSPGSQYANEVSRGELARLFRRHGCHHCGSRRGPVVGDHIPPNRMVWGSSKGVVPASVQRHVAKGLGLVAPKRQGKLGRGARAKSGLGATVAPLLARLRSALAIEPTMPSQRYFPQCKRCSGRQSTAVRLGKRMLVLHLGGPKAPCYAGVIVGLRHFQALPGQPPAGQGSVYRRRSTGPSGDDPLGLREWLQSRSL